jgi:uncharacterized protein
MNPARLRWLTLAAICVAVLSCALRKARAEVVLGRLEGHVVDLAGALTSAEEATLEARLDRERRERGFTIVTLVVRSLDGEPIEDLAYRAFNTWQIGDEERDDGVLLVVALEDRRARIETGKGVGGALTDIESVHILRDTVGPRLAEGRSFEALDAGTRAIAERLEHGGAATGEPAPNGQTGPAGFPWLLVLLGLALVLSIVSPTARAAIFALLASGRRGGGGGLAGGYRGGGGSSGGGGASSDW